MKPSQPNPLGSTPIERLCAWLTPVHARRLHRRGWTQPLRLAGAVPPADWPTWQRLQSLMHAERLRSEHAQLWRTSSAVLPLDPRAWTHERRLGDQVISGLLNERAVHRELQEGGWLQVRQLHRVDAGLARAMASAQQALGWPLRAHAWYGQVGRGHSHALTQAADDASLRIMLVLEGVLRVVVGSTPDAPTQRTLRGGPGDLLIIPPGAHVQWRTSGRVWAIELQVQVLTPLDLLREWGTAALQSLRDDPALRRCPKSSASSLSDRSHLHLALQAHADPSVALALARHQARLDDGHVPSNGRLRTLSRLLQVDAHTPLVGHPERIRERLLNADRLTLRLARKELHFEPGAARLLDFMLQDQPYQLQQAPGRHALADRLQLARSLAVEGLVQAMG